MVKDEKPNPLNYNACFILAKAAQVQKDTDTALVFYRACAKEATKLGSASKIIDVFDGMVDLYSPPRSTTRPSRPARSSSTSRSTTSTTRSTRTSRSSWKS